VGARRVVEAYGGGPLQRGEWWIPEAARTPLPTIVLVHGGFWRPRYDRSLEDAVAADLCDRGFLCWNIDYAASDHPWPTTLTDVAAGYDHVVSSGRVDRDRIAVVGHSAGGHLALWLASRHRLPPEAPGAIHGDLALPRLCVAQAPVAALAQAASEGIGGGAVQAFVGGAPGEVPDRYAVADPLVLLPTRIRTLLVHGDADEAVPLSQSETYIAAAKAAGNPSSLQVYPGAHFEHLDPTSAAVDVLRRALAEWL
jgi:acetyl esterase/lipase